MKKKLHLYFCFSIFIFIACNSLKLTPEEKTLRMQQVSTDIENKNYTIKINQAKPMRGKVINLSPTYDLIIRNDSAIAYLPFFGYATQAPFPGTDGGIHFAQKIENYLIKSLSKNNGWEIRFDINTVEYNYKLKLSVFHSGESTVDITSVQRDPIFFFGEVK